MIDNADLERRLDAIGAKIEHWRADAKLIRALADQTLSTRDLSPERMVEIEEKAGEIYREIANFDTLLIELGDVETPGRDRLPKIADDLRLVLMEITELGTSMYSVRSDEPDARPEV